MPCADLASALSQLGIEISATIIWRMLKKVGFCKTKPTRKPGLTKKMREEQYKWCLAHKDWTLEDWKNVIWTDETAVVLNCWRGGY
jgi:transposase